MPTKTLKVELKQSAGFKTACTAGKHTLFIDQPAETGGADAGPTPLDYQMFALGGCITAVGRIIANQKRLPIRGFEVSVEGDINTDGILGKASGTRVGFTAITVRVKIDADLSDAEKAQLLRDIEARCPISENLQHDTPVSVLLAP